MKIILGLILFCWLNVKLIEAQWSTIGVGVQYRQLPIGDANNVLITYAGWLVDVTHVWTDRLLSKSILNQTEYGIRHAYSVKGPRTTDYRDKEIENSKLITHLYNLAVSGTPKPKLIVIIAHSSGSFVADEFFAQLFAKISASPNDPVYSAISRRIVYYNLDGATTPSRKDTFYVQTLFSNVNFVWASKASLRSMNSATMIAAPVNYVFGPWVKSIEVTANMADCANSRCMHDAVIIESPWDPNNFDTARDYTLFAMVGREVQSAYLKPADLNNTMNLTEC